MLITSQDCGYYLNYLMALFHVMFHNNLSLILPVALYGCENRSLTLWEEHRLQVFENRVLRRIFGSKGDEVTGKWRKLHNGELHNLYHHQILLGTSNQRECGWSGMWQAWERGETCTGFGGKAPSKKTTWKTET
jgi:hypothetical protein